MPSRYDHRKLAFQNNPRWKKRRVSTVLNLKEIEENFTRERRGTLDVGGGLLGYGRTFNQNNAGNFQKLPSSRQPRSRQGGGKGNRRRGTIYVTESEISTKRKETRRQLHYDTDEAADMCDDMDRSYGNGNHLAGILESGGADDEEALQNIMVHLEEKQKKREQAKYGEDFKSIKERMAELLDEYTESDEEEFDVTKLADPDFFVSKETKEKNSAQSMINKILEEYLETCHDRADILSSVYDALNFEEIMRTVKSPEAEDLDNVSSEISMTIEMIQQSSGKLSKLYNRLLKLYTAESKSSENPQVQSQLRQLDLQKQVISKFKTLQHQKVKQKEKVDTWKYAANEIVDLLKSVRKEGATDFEQLEKEFQKLLVTFQQQSRLIEDHQDTISRQKANIKKIEAMKEKLKNDNSLLQDEYDRSRVQAKTMQMKCAKLEVEVKNVQEKLTEAENATAEYTKNLETRDTSRMGGTVSTTKAQEDSPEAKGRIEDLQMQLQRVEKQLKIEQLKNKDLVKKMNSKQEAQLLSPSIMIDDLKKIDSESEVEPSHQDLKGATPNNLVPLKKKCIKCASFKTRLEELCKDLNSKREQVVVLSKRLAELEGENKSAVIESIDQTNINTNATTKGDMIQRGGEMFTSKIEESVQNTPILPNPSNSLETNAENNVNSPEKENISIIRSSTKQIIVYQEISTEKMQKSIPVLDQQTQTDFSMERPVILKQRASIPTQSVIAKNYSSLVDEDIKNMAGRIYSYVNSVDKAFEENRSSGGEGTIDPIAEETSDASTIDSTTDDRKEPDDNTIPKDNVTAQTQGKTNKPTRNSKARGPIGGTEGDSNNNHKEHTPPLQIHVNEEQTTGQAATDDAIKRRGNESGFFDDSGTSTKVDKSESSSRKWNLVRSGVVNHILRFLNNAAKKRCSYLHQAFQFVDPSNKSDEQIIKAELAVFAEHAIDMLDVISYTVKQMNESSNIPLTVPEGLEESITSKFRENWQPYRDNAKSARVKFNDADLSSEKRQNDPHLPEIKQQAPASAKSKQKKTDDDTTKEMKAKVAEKKRMKILERHKKLVTKLRQSGVGLKQIYTILGIQINEQEEEMPNHILPRNANRKISLVGHGYRNDMLKTQDYHEEKLKRMTGLTMHGVGGVRGFSRRLSLVDIDHRQQTVFPAIGGQRKLAVQPVTFGNNFFQTRPLTPRGKSNVRRR